MRAEADNAQRLAVLAKYEIMDTESEPSYDELVHLASKVCDAPFAVITLLDDSRQWFKSQIGLDVTETAREISFCHYAILQDEAMVIPETLDDERFRNNPLVIDGPKFRSYAGVPLITPEKVKLGTLCVLDTIPRVFSAKAISLLEKLGSQVMGHLDARRTHIRDRAFNQEQALEINKLKKDLAKLEWLEGLITICSNCKNIKDDDGVWLRIESYIQKNSSADFSHGICPGCRELLYPGLSKSKPS